MLMVEIFHSLQEFGVFDVFVRLWTINNAVFMGIFQSYWESYLNSATEIMAHIYLLTWRSERHDNILVFWYLT